MNAHTVLWVYIVLMVIGGVMGFPTGPHELLTNVVAISAGLQHSAALRADGTVLCWGYNIFYDQTNVPPNLSNVIAIACGSFHTLALTEDGGIVAWGR
jgi:alpha-tubulin suppressor-like RCC1 family protein